MMELLAALVGGLGLFMLGMGMMTDGLKVAAGPALERILSGSTRTRLRALGSGMLVTALVQSSSAVTVATIGFVNAGLLNLGAALWVLFGANVGTTMTGWLVALVGLKFEIEALALPMVGVGVVLRLVGEGRRRGALGTAVAGFGLLFLGIAMLQEGFAGATERVSLPQGEGLLAAVAQVGAGTLMTVLMQSSSASMAIALTAAQGGLLSPQAAAAVVIGSNIGTTVTAVLAALGATPNARRAAAAHVAFNALTAVVALAMLPWLVGAIGTARDALGLPADPASGLALFHTLFNVMGVLLVWPLAGHLTRWLERRWRGAESDPARPRHLDDTVLAVPSLALEALEREVARIGATAARMLREAVNGADAAALAADGAVVEALDRAVERFVERMHRSAMSADTGARLPLVLRIERYHETVAEQALAAARLTVPQRPLREPLRALAAAFAAAVGRLLDTAGSATPDDRIDAMQAMEQHYEALKSALLAAGASGTLDLPDMDRELRRFSALRRAAQQAGKAARLAAGGPIAPVAASGSA